MDDSHVLLFGFKANEHLFLRADAVADSAQKL